MCIAMTSLAVTEVVVKSLRVVERIKVPEERLTPLVEMESLLVGCTVPVATFQNLTVTVPASTTKVYCEMVQAKGTGR